MALSQLHLSYFCSIFIHMTIITSYEHPTISNGFIFMYYIFPGWVDNKGSEKINDLLQGTWEDWRRARLCTPSFLGP